MIARSDLLAAFTEIEECKRNLLEQNDVISDTTARARELEQLLKVERHRMSQIEAFLALMMHDISSVYAETAICYEHLSNSYDMWRQQRDSLCTKTTELLALKNQLHSSHIRLLQDTDDHKQVVDDLGCQIKKISSENADLRSLNEVVDYILMNMCIHSLKSNCCFTRNRCRTSQPSRQGKKVKLAL